MTPFRSIIAAVLCASVALTPTGDVAAAPCWRPPVSAPVTDPFREPACPWCAGNRGIEYGTRRGATVRAVATGRVTFAGTVAGTIYIVVRHGDGRRVTYGNLAGENVDRGELIVRGQRVGTAAGRFHLGLRDGTTYVDPAPFLGRLTFRPRLVPIDGTSANQAPPPRLSCRSS